MLAKNLSHLSAFCSSVVSVSQPSTSLNRGDITLTSAPKYQLLSATWVRFARREQNAVKSKKQEAMHLAVQLVDNGRLLCFFRKITSKYHAKESSAATTAPSRTLMVEVPRLGASLMKSGSGVWHIPKTSISLNPS